MSMSDKAKNAALSMAIHQALGYLEKDPETNIPKLMALVDKVVPSDWYVSQRDAFRNVITDKNNNWYQLIMKVYELDPGVRKVFFQNFILNASLLGSATQEETAARGHPAGPHLRLQPPLYRLLGGRVRQQAESDL